MSDFVVMVEKKIHDTDACSYVCILGVGFASNVPLFMTRLCRIMFGTFHHYPSL